MSSQRVPLSKIFLFLTVVISALLVYDIHHHGSFKKSKTGQLMKDTGLLAICEQAWGKIAVYSGKAYKWLEVNVPIFNDWLCRTWGPYLQLFWEKLIALLIYLWNSTEGIRSWINVNIPPLLKWVNDNLPYYIAKLAKSTEGIALFILDSSLNILKFLQHYISIITTWLHANVFTGSLSIDNLQKYAGNTIQMFQQYTISTYQWISKYVATVIYPGK